MGSLLLLLSVACVALSTAVSPCPSQPCSGSPAITLRVRPWAVSGRGSAHPLPATRPHLSSSLGPPCCSHGTCAPLPATGPAFSRERAVCFVAETVGPQLPPYPHAGAGPGRKHALSPSMAECTCTRRPLVGWTSCAKRLTLLVCVGAARDRI